MDYAQLTAFVIVNERGNFSWERNTYNFTDSEFHEIGSATK